MKTNRRRTVARWAQQPIDDLLSEGKKVS